MCTVFKTICTEIKHIHMREEKKGKIMDDLKEEKRLFLF